MPCLTSQGRTSEPSDPRPHGNCCAPLLVVLGSSLCPGSQLYLCLVGRGRAGGSCYLEAMSGGGRVDGSAAGLGLGDACKQALASPWGWGAWRPGPVRSGCLVCALILGARGRPTGQTGTLIYSAVAAPVPRAAVGTVERLLNKGGLGSGTGTRPVCPRWAGSSCGLARALPALLWAPGSSSTVLGGLSASDRDVLPGGSVMVPGVQPAGREGEGEAGLSGLCADVKQRWSGLQVGWGPSGAERYGLGC